MQTLINIVKYVQNVFRELLCQHKWVFWHTRFIVDPKSKSHIRHLNGKIQYNQYRLCEKCNKKQSWKQAFENSKWIRSYRTLDPNIKTINIELKIAGEESKADKRNRLIEKILKK